jgi:hypothetical protein
MTSARPALIENRGPADRQIIDRENRPRAEEGGISCVVARAWTS